MVTVVAAYAQVTHPVPAAEQAWAHDRAADASVARRARAHHRGSGRQRRHDGGVMMQPIYPARLRNETC